MHWISRKIRQLIDMLTFRQKLILILFTFMSLLMIASVLNTKYTNDQYVENQTTNNEEYTLDIATQYFSNMLTEITKTMSAIMFDNEISNNLNNILDESISPTTMIPEINAGLDNITLNNDVFVVVYVPGEKYNYSNRAYEHQFDDEKLKEVIPVLENNTVYDIHWFDSSFDLLSEEWQRNNDYNGQMIVAGRKITNNTGNTIGYMFAGLKEESFDYIPGIDNSGVDREFFLINDNNDILYSTNSNESGINSVYYEWLRGKKASPFVVFNEKKYFVAERMIPNVNWNIATVIPYEQMTAHFDEAYTINGYVFFAIFVVTMLILIQVIHRYTRPIAKIAHVANEISNGNMEIRSNIRRNDEIGRLAIAFDLMLDHIQSIIEQIKMERKLKREAEISVLQAKIKPHFIFNLLSTIRIKIIQNNDMETANIVKTFTLFLKNIYSGKEFIMIDEEMNENTNYIALVNAMRKHPVELQLNIAPETGNIKVPRLLTQPIVENSFKHGFTENGGVILIETKLDNGFIYLSIQDNGKGIKQETLSNLRDSLIRDKKMVVKHYQEKSDDVFGIGLVNVYERLVLTYGEQSDMQIESNEGQWTKITIKFPVQQERI